MMPKPSSSLLYLLALTLCATGCVTVTFPEPMPVHRRNLKSFPKSWQGEWKAVNDGKEDAENEDVMTIVSDRILSDGQEDLVIGEQVVLRRMGRRLVLNIEGEGQSPRWTLAVAQKSGDQILVRQLDPKLPGALRRWGNVVGEDRIKLVYDEDDPNDKLREVQLNPRGNAAFRRLVRFGASETMTYQRVQKEPTP
jgi:hypothetical protein